MMPNAMKTGDVTKFAAMTHLKVKTFDAQTAGLSLDHAVILGTPILTLDGALPVEFLTPGDRILTRAGSRKLRCVEVTVVRHARVIRIAHDTLGVDRPDCDVVVTPDQPILIRDWRAKALCGTPTALVAAARLVDGDYIRAETLPEARFYTLRFDEDAVIYAGGLELSCAAETVSA
jgi:hypothetical protein